MFTISSQYLYFCCAMPKNRLHFAQCFGEFLNILIYICSKLPWSRVLGECPSSAALRGMVGEPTPRGLKSIWAASCVHLTSSLPTVTVLHLLHVNLLSSTAMPQGMLNWRSDKWFGVQRLQGVNPVLITLCTRIPDKSVSPHPHQNDIQMECVELDPLPANGLHLQHLLPKRAKLLGIRRKKQSLLLSVNFALIFLNYFLT